MNNNQENMDQQNMISIQDEAMKRTNQTLSKIRAEVREMINGKEQADNME